MIDRILTIWSRVETVLIGLLIVAAICVFLGGTLIRIFSPLNAIDWADEISIYCIIWATVLSGSVLAAEGRHINTEILVNMLPEGPRRAVGIAIFALVLGFCCVMAWFGWEAFGFTLMLDERSASTLRVPQGWAVFLALPVGMALIVVRMVLLALAGRYSVSEGATTLPEAPK